MIGGGGGTDVHNFCIQCEDEGWNTVAHRKLVIGGFIKHKVGLAGGVIPAGETTSKDNPGGRVNPKPRKEEPRTSNRFENMSNEDVHENHRNGEEKRGGKGEMCFSLLGFMWT